MRWLSGLIFLLTLPAYGAEIVVAQQQGATAPEQLAAKDLAKYLSEGSGRQIPVTNTAPVGAIIVGPGELAKKFFPEIDLEKFGPEELVMKTKNGRLLLAGGRPRGTMYAVNRFLQNQRGVRWWTPWATTVPKRPLTSLPILDVHEKPYFEYREPYWFHATDAGWSAHNCVNGALSKLDDAHGGKTVYHRGFVHTFYGLVPPEKYFATHPEWFSLINGQRTAGNAQLCTTNPQLREHIVQEVEAWLKENPKANIVSVSQNDCFNPCQCPNCKALDDAEGSHAGSMLALVNYVAERIEKDHPNVAVDTLAYQYTRHAPKTIIPRKNVIVRLCSIECNFAAPIDDATNQAFAQDVRDWSKLTDRLYIWNYVTNFAHYIQPQPNWFTLGPTMRFFADHGVKGVFDEGAYNSCGGEMSELRAWVEAQLYWDPKLDDKKLIDEFLAGYYGRAAQPIKGYLDLMSKAAAKSFMTCYSAPTSDYLGYSQMAQAERLWQGAEKMVANDRELLHRVQVAHMPVRYVFLQRWPEFQRVAKHSNDTWPLSPSRRIVAQQFLEAGTEPGPPGWSAVDVINEGGLRIDPFVARYSTDPPPPPVLPSRPAHVALPSDITIPQDGEAIDAQDNLARLAREGDWAELRSDPSASDGIACWMPQNHHEWAFQLPAENLPEKTRSGRWRVYLVARSEEVGGAPGANAIAAGVYDSASGRDVTMHQFPVSATSTKYKSYDLGVFELKPGIIIWVSPQDNGAAKGVWIDRVVLVRQG